MSVFGDLAGPYGTIVADPPWAYENASGIITTAKKGATAASKYSSMTNAELVALPVADIAAENAHLYLWVTNPLLYSSPRPDEIMAAWGFRYVTCLTWLKKGTLGMGYYFRGETEHVLFGVRGKAPIPPERRRVNWFAASKAGHSVKPGCFGDLVESVSPGPYVELFCRQARFGWDSWGHGFELH